MERDDTYISKEKLLTLKLIAVGPSTEVEEYDEYTGEPIKFYRSDVTDFVFVDKYNNRYIHGQVNPSSLKGKQLKPAQAFLRGISNGEYSDMGYVLADNMYSKWQEFVGNYYACVVRKKKWGNHTTRHVESLFYDFPTTLKNNTSKAFENTPVSAVMNYVEDVWEEERIKLKYAKKALKNKKK